MTEEKYYFIKPYDKSYPLPPKESLGQILSEAYLHPFKWNYRTTRKSYWISFLTNIIISLLCSFLFTFNNQLKPINITVAILVLIWLFLSGLGQTVRRLHDVNYSGYWYWVGILSIGSFFLLYLYLQPSAQVAVKWNQYLFTDAKPYGDYTGEVASDVPTPPITQIVKEHFFDCFKWDARSTRTSFWVGSAISNAAGNIVSLFILAFSYGAFGSIRKLYVLSLEPEVGLGVLIVAILVLLVLCIWMFLADLGHTVRRLHDAGFSGGWFWISLIPGLGYIILNFLLFHPTTKNEVKWNGYLFNTKK
ncbi:uncharacterized membrane protein YhaH (DUF805 family) [Lactobacillus colini]|uniref:Uncharacterized membrane protein YhaH (DUF805 family) n=1 Tax=Lactobacillus colini TaxID=1819254 RepID=A0ABS4MHR5_9LACO|nr:DUF805 domain-containing protein [Lactobacillus colini]MBP2058877.1 uncharacterized membrane protein YhaH (DUF805 family) [Lactobacillus colini]